MLDANEDEHFYLLRSGIAGHKVLNSSFPIFVVRLTPGEFFTGYLNPFPGSGPKDS